MASLNDPNEVKGASFGHSWANAFYAERRRNKQILKWEYDWHC